MSERLDMMELLGACRFSLRLTVAQRKALAALSADPGAFVSSAGMMQAVWGEQRHVRHLSRLLAGLAAKLRRYGLDISRRRGIGWTLALVRELRPWMARGPGDISMLVRERRG